MEMNRTPQLKLLRLSSHQFFDAFPVFKNIHTEFRIIPQQRDVPGDVV